MQTDWMPMPIDRATLEGIRRGFVVWVELDPAFGFEQKKLRPAIVVSNDILNGALATLVVVPVTSDKGKRPRAHEVRVPKGEGGLPSDSIAQPQQVRTIDRFQRVVKVGDRVSEGILEELGDALRLALDLLPEGLSL